MNALELRGLTKRYPGFTLDHLDLPLPTGCILGLVGENGAGKSTTMKLILGMLKAEEGTVTVLGHEKYSKEDVGVVLDEVGIPGILNAAQVGRIMAGTFRNWEQSTFESLLSRLAVPMDKPFKTLSKGMKMKLGIAVALSHGAKLLLLDDATSGLDPVARDAVLDILNDFTRQENHTVLLSSHIVSDLEKICDYIAFLHKGKLLLCQEKDRLLEDYGILHCTGEVLDSLDSGAILHSKYTRYGAEALVHRDRIPAGMQVSPITIEELFISMAKEETQ